MTAGVENQSGNGERTICANRLPYFSFLFFTSLLWQQWGRSYVYVLLLLLFGVCIEENFLNLPAKYSSINCISLRNICTVMTLFQTF